MTEKKPSNLTVSQQGGIVRNVLNQLKLIFRLMGDSRVNAFAKLVPIGALIYLVSPLDAAIPFIGPLDDAALLWLGSYIFTELCPPAVVEEHMRELAGEADSASVQGDIVEGETTDVSDKP